MLLARTAARTASTARHKMTAARQAREQLVAIVGPTGVGKSELGVLLAAQHAPRAVIVNTDAMQLYAGLDVITNKLPMNERVGVEHKLISHVDPFTTSQLVIADFERDALREIEQAHDDGKLAFALGGTAYYTQHLLFPGRLVSSAATSGPASHDGQAELDPKETDAAFISRFSDELQARLASLEAHELALLRNVVSLPALSSPSATLSLQSGSPTLSSLIPSAYLATSSLRDVSDDSDGPGGGKDKLAVSDLSAWLYALLTKLDPQGAARWHWRDVRKVRRALELIILRRTTWAEVLQDQDRQIGLSPASRQREDAGASGSTGAAPARFDTLVLWLWAEQEALSKRLDERVERMLDAGLLAEVAAMRAARRRLIGDGEAGTEEDFTTGIWQAIGYRQFVPYLEALEQRGQPLPAAQATSEEEDAELAKLLREGIEQTQLATRQYAKRQLKWIRSKLARAINDANQLAAASSGGNGKSCELVLLDATDLAQWRTRVFEPAKVALDGTRALSLEFLAR